MSPIFQYKDVTEPGATNGILDAYNRHGWVLIRKAIPENVVAGALRALAKIKSVRPPVLTQNTHEWIRPTIDSHGNMVNSIQSPSKHLHLGGSRKLLIDLISHPNISTVLSALSGSKQFVSWQDMLFDRSTGTADHFDSYYLDTHPNGSMIAAWIALEDIRAESGPFFVTSAAPLERDSLKKLKGLKHSDFVAACAEHRERNLEVTKATIDRGDVLFWHPMTIHGAEEPLSDSATRKSVTSHYYPVGAYREKQPTEPARAKDMSKMLKTKNSNIFLSNSFNDNHIRFTFFGLRRFLKELLIGARYQHTIMNRSAYKIKK